MHSQVNRNYTHNYSYEEEVVSQKAQSNVQVEDDSKQASTTNSRHSLTTGLGLQLSALILHIAHKSM